jgi:murein DD-endopeptidase MepM/ murein hydrolase activator NlpD
MHLLESSALEPGQSIYHLYAHLQAPTSLAVDDFVVCGQPLGAVGTTGASVVPHLHLEIRVGPAEVNFHQMAYYDTRAREQEMMEYETWRIQGRFRSIDPRLVFFAQ